MPTSVVPTNHDHTPLQAGGGLRSIARSRTRHRRHRHHDRIWSRELGGDRERTASRCALGSLTSGAALATHVRIRARPHWSELAAVDRQAVSYRLPRARRAVVLERPLLPTDAIRVPPGRGVGGRGGAAIACATSGRPTRLPARLYADFLRHCEHSSAAAQLLPGSPPPCVRPIRPRPDRLHHEHSAANTGRRRCGNPGPPPNSSTASARFNP